jgi:hypothetical protein
MRAPHCLIADGHQNIRRMPKARIKNLQASRHGLHDFLGPAFDGEQIGCGRNIGIPSPLLPVLDRGKRKASANRCCDMRSERRIAFTSGM